MFLISFKIKDPIKVLILHIHVIFISFIKISMISNKRLLIYIKKIFY